MKRSKLIKYIEVNGGEFVREGANHSLYKNIKNGRLTTIPRHSDIKESLCRKICKDLGIEDILK
jgi:predicted RNA binding protein YcfA (HicA-like mRNA interferase family)